MIKNFCLLSKIILIFALFSCSKYQKILKSNDPEAKYNAALQYFEKGDYYRAFPLFEDLINIYKGTLKAEKIYFYYAYCYYKLDDYFSAGYYFKNFAKTFPNNEKAEEAMFLSAYCNYLESPISSLDQTSTYKAIEELQLFINLYPNSAKIDTCNLLIDKLRNKLETKAYDISKLYFNTQDYKSAIISFKNLIKDFPDTDYKKESYYYIVNSSYLLAVNSIEAKKKERLEATIKEYNNYINLFSNNSEINQDIYLKELQTIYENTKKELSKIHANSKNPES